MDDARRHRVAHAPRVTEREDELSDPQRRRARRVGRDEQGRAVLRRRSDEAERGEAAGEQPPADGDSDAIASAGEPAVEIEEAA